MGDYWLAAYNVRELVAGRRNLFGKPNITNLEYAIIDYARTVLPARCKYMWDKSIGLDVPTERIETRNADIPPWVWNLTDDLKIDWDTGIFHLSGDIEGVTKYVKLVGVEFDGTAVDQIWPVGNIQTGGSIKQIGEKSAETKLPSNAGRKRSVGWDNWIAYLAVAAPDIIREEGVEALIDKVANLMAGDGLEPMPRTTVQSAAQAVINLLQHKKL